MDKLQVGQAENSQDMLGYLKFGIVGKKIMLTDKIFTIDLRRAVILEKKLLKMCEEFITEA